MTLKNVETTLDALAGLPIWAARGKETGKRKRAPINPKSGGYAQSNNPDTWAKRPLAEKRAAKLPDAEIRGVGLMLGPHGAPDGFVLAALDLDGCVENGAIADWADSIRHRLDSYSEFSPSGTGLRLLFFVRESDVSTLRADGLIENLGKQFAKGDHVEIAIYFGKRYVSITDNLVENLMGDAADTIEHVALANLEWLLRDFGPEWQGATETSRRKKTKDDSGSGAAYRFALDSLRAGLSEEATVTAFEADDGGPGDWWNRTTEREQRRVVERAAQKVESDKAELEDMLPDEIAEGGDTGEALFADQDGVIRAFTKKHKDGLRYDHMAGSWYKFDGNVWRKESTKLAHHYARVLATKMAKHDPKAKAKALLNVASWEAVERGARMVREFVATPEDWNRDPLLLGTPGGTVDLRTGVLRKGDPDDHISRLAAVAPIPLDSFKPERDCPKWMAFLYEALADDAEAIRFLQMWGGYSLTGVTKEQALVFVHGVGGGGKSTAINTMAEVAGEYSIGVATSTLTASKHDGHAEEIARLDGPRMAYASETEKGRAWAENRIKSLTGGDTVTARFMRENSFDFKPQFKLAIVGNHAPVIKSVDEAIKRRFIILPFDHPPKRRDNDLPDKLRAEWPGIMSWMIQGCLDWQNHGLIRPAVAQRATEAYFEAQDIFGQWLEECCEVGPSHADTGVNLWQSWQRFAASQGEEPGNRIRGFPETLLERGFDKIRNRDGISGRGFKGLRVADHVGTGESDELL